MSPFNPEQCDIECRRNGILVVRVHSVDRMGRPLPDAVFTFRPGDPQYEYWYQIAKERRLL